MRIDYVEAAGFRGARLAVRIECPGGFAVLTGPNGSGKSTVCDAIEYALTGTLARFSGGKERGESVDDYIWWRGPGRAPEHVVRVGLIAADGKKSLIERRPGAAAPHSQVIADLVCAKTMRPANAVEELCRTTFIRDETIAALSIDLPEADRFSFVRAALGTDAFEGVSTKGKALLGVLDRGIKGAETEYRIARDRVAGLVAQLAAVRATIKDQAEIPEAEHNIRQFLGQPTGDSTAVLATARQRVIALRKRIDALRALRRELAAVREEHTLLNASELQKRIDDVTSQRDGLRHRLVEVKRRIEELTELVAADRHLASTRLSLAALHEHAERVGMRNGRCPVCGTALDVAAFQAALGTLGRELGADERAAAERAAQLAERLAEARDLETRQVELEAALREIERNARNTEARVAAGIEAARQLGVAVSDAMELERLDAEEGRATDAVRLLEDNVLVMESSAGIAQIADLEHQLVDAQERSDECEARLKEIQTADQVARARLAGIRRAIGELVEERLASLEPVLADLYTRLRPHVDWAEIRYHLRGDVRRFLSLSVGDDVNPRFTFSSGQRRALGLAFLLAVYLSRPWCQLETLILDDPVQHIDDFRALHLVEVLAAIRRSRRQVICAIEDRALADALCRRLGVDEVDAGTLVEMEYRPGDGASVRGVTPAKQTVGGLLLTG